MVRTTTLFALLATASTVLAQATCGLEQKCPSDTPCCSQYGQCGVGAYCLGGCDPRASFSLDSCTPEPVCQSKTYNFNSLDRITPNTQYLGDSSKSDWVSSGQPVLYDNNVLLTMQEGSVGTLLASTTYMWYGSVEATFKTSRGQGVVTAFILLSDVKDEIDYEFVGADLESAQSNYYFQGIPNYDNELNISLSDTFANYHTYKIDWTPDAITWSIDGQPGRTKKRSETYNATSNQWDFPQTPSRVQLSLWPAGSPDNGKGTIDWAGGLIDWNAQDVKNNGYYYAMFQSVTINCFNATSAPGTNSGKSYTYNNVAGTNNTVVDGNDNTVLGSFLATGTNMTLGATTASASGSATPSSSVQTVPGLVNGGSGTNSHNDGDDASPQPSGSSSSQSGGSGSSGSSGSSSGYTGSGFSQGGSSSSSSSNGKSGAETLNPEKVLKGSVFAVIVAVAAMLAL